MLRAVRLQSKLPLRIAEDAQRVIAQQGQLLQQVSGARLFDESLKLLMNGYAFKCFENLNKSGLLKELFPCTARYYDSNEQVRRLYQQALNNSDERVTKGKAITPSFLLAIFLWPEVLSKVDYITQANSDLSPQEIMQRAMHSSIEEQLLITSIPRRFQIMMREIWQLQHRLSHQMHSEKRAKSTLAHPRFRAAFDFLLVREDSGEIQRGAGKWWQKFQVEHADILERSKLERQKQYKSRFKKKKRPRK